MAFTKRKIAAWTHPVSAESDRPARTAAEMKAIFDSNSNQLKEAFNGLVDDLSSPEAAKSIGSAAIERIAGATVYEQLVSLRDYADGIGIESGAMVSVNGKTGKSITLTAADVGAATAPVVLTVLLAANGWEGNGPFTQRAEAAGVTETAIVDVSPSVSSFTAYCDCAVRAIAQEEGALLFAAENLPEADLFASVRVTA